MIKNMLMGLLADMKECRMVTTWTILWVVICIIPMVVTAMITVR
jgi:hypothetical protein